MTKKEPLRKQILAGCVLFILSLGIFLSVANYFGYRSALYQRYNDYITDLLAFSAANIDVDDLKECLESGEKSKKYEETQLFFDTIKDTHGIDFIYVIIPLNKAPVDNIMNVIAGMSSYEKAYKPENAVTLGGLTGTDYTAEIAAKYYDAMNMEGRITFFESAPEKWGKDYTGILPLYDSNGEFFAELCVDVSVTEIRGVITRHVLLADVFIVLIGALFTALFLLWIKKAVADPLQGIEEKVVDFAMRSHGQMNPNELFIEMPVIKAENELHSLSHAITKMSEDMRDYLIKMISARNEADVANMRVMELSEQASRDPLTGIRNRNAYDAESKKIDHRIAREGFSKFGIVMVDLNDLKKINDAHGHEKGNHAIVKICQSVCRTFTHSPVFRVGGDTFVVILLNEDFDSAETKLDTFDHLLKRNAEDATLPAWEKISAAVGWTKYNPMLDQTVEDVYKRADQKMYECKTKMKSYSAD